MMARGRPLDTGGVVSAIRRKGAMLAALSLLAGCVSLGGRIPEMLIGLTPESVAPAGALGGGRVADALLVLDPDTDPELDVRRVPVQVDDATIAYLKDAMWVDRPARLFRQLLAETIRARGQRLVLEESDRQIAGSAKLSGRLLSMGYDARSHSVVVRYDALHEELDGTIASRRFESVVPGVAPTPETVASALNKAANSVAAQVAEWLG